MFKKLHKAFIQGLLNPETYDSHLVGKYLTERNEVEVNNIVFIDEDLPIEVPNYNRPLYLEGCVNRVYLNKILIDPSSAVNMMSYRTLKKIGYTSNDLEFESVVIQGFSLNNQSTMGSIRLTI